MHLVHIIKEIFTYIYIYIYIFYKNRLKYEWYCYYSFSLFVIPRWWFSKSIKVCSRHLAYPKSKFSLVIFYLVNRWNLFIELYLPKGTTAIHFSIIPLCNIILITATSHRWHVALFFNFLSHNYELKWNRTTDFRKLWILSNILQHLFFKKADLTYSFPMHLFSTPWKYQKTCFQRLAKGCIVNKWVKSNVVTSLVR